MITVTKDPITLNDVTDLDAAPYVIEGSGSSAMKISRAEANRQEYLATEMHGSLNSSGLKRIFDDIADSPITGSIN